MTVCNFVLCILQHFARLQFGQVDTQAHSLSSVIDTHRHTMAITDKPLKVLIVGGGTLLVNKMRERVLILT